MKCLICGGRDVLYVSRPVGRGITRGMGHPNVLKAGKIDPDEYNGFAWSGLDRLVMMKYGIEDIRHLHSGDLRFVFNSEGLRIV